MVDSESKKSNPERIILSIVIPVYNVKDYLPKCINSILTQDCSDCEIILVDDGSTDGESGAICDRYAQENPELISVIHKENGGLGDARNVGESYAQGEYVLFVDSDDYLAEDTLFKLKVAADEYKCDIITFGYVFDTDGKLSEPQLENLPERTIFCMDENKRLMLSSPNACFRIWRRTFLAETGIKYPGRVWYEDIRTTMKLLALAKSVVYLPETFYRYVIREGSIMNNKNLGRNGEIIDAMDDLIAWYKENGLYEQYEEELCALTVLNVLHFATVRVVKVDPKHELLKRFRDYTMSAFPQCMSNKYVTEMPLKQKIVIKLAAKGRFNLLHLMFSAANR